MHTNPIFEFVSYLLHGTKHASCKATMDMGTYNGVHDMMFCEWQTTSVERRIQKCAEECLGCANWPIQDNADVYLCSFVNAHGCIFLYAYVAVPVPMHVLCMLSVSYVYVCHVCKGLYPGVSVWFVLDWASMHYLVHSEKTDLRPHLATHLWSMMLLCVVWVFMCWMDCSKSHNLVFFRDRKAYSLRDL